MAIDIYLTIAGVPGESKAAGFIGAIEVLSFSWGISNPSHIDPGSGAGAGKPQFSDISVVKNFDLASPLLMQKLASGTHLPKIVLSCVKEAGENRHMPFLTYEFDEVLVTSLQDSASGEVPTEAVSFTYGKVVVDYFTQDSTGRTMETKFGWDISRNA